MIRRDVLDRNSLKLDTPEDRYNALQNEILNAYKKDLKQVLEMLQEGGWQLIKKTGVNYTLVKRGKIIEVTHYGDIIRY